jgi:hypothetical protein
MVLCFVCYRPSPLGWCQRQAGEQEAMQQDCWSSYIQNGRKVVATAPCRDDPFIVCERAAAKRSLPVCM